MIFPFIDEVDVEESQEEEIPLAKEWAFDFSKGEFQKKNGKMYIVEGLEAVKIWAQKALLTERYAHTVYSWDYGNEMFSLIGSDYSQAATEEEVKRFVNECLMISPYINEVINFDIVFEKESLSVGCTLDTIYGEVEVSA